MSRGLRWPARARGLCGLRWPAAGGCATIYKATIYKATGRQSNGAPSEQRRAPSRRWGLLATMPRAHRSARRYTRRRAEGLPKGRQAATEGEPGGRAGGVVACGGRAAVIGLRWPGGCLRRRRTTTTTTPTPAEIWRRASTYLWEMPTPEEEGDADGHLPIGGDGDAQKKESERRQQHIYARRNMEAGIYLPTGNDYARRGRRR